MTQSAGPEGITCVLKKMGSILYYAKSVDPTIFMSQIILRHHRALVTLYQRSLHVQKGVGVPLKMVRTEGLQLEYQLGRKLPRSSLINFSSV